MGYQRHDSYDASAPNPSPITLPGITLATTPFAHMALEQNRPL